MIQPPKLTQLASSYLPDPVNSTTVEDWLKQTRVVTSRGHRPAGPSPAFGHQDNSVTSTSPDCRTVPSSPVNANTDDDDDGYFSERRLMQGFIDRSDAIHPAGGLQNHHRPSTPVPACDELFFADFDLPNDFEPSEIWVTVDEDALVVEGEHRELCNNFYECHEYFRKVPLPEDVDTSQLKCTLQRDGHMIVEAPLVHNITEIIDNMEMEEAVRNIPD